jgi:hypothetical protein
MSRDWNTTVLASLPEALGVLANLHRKAWLCRGQAKTYGTGCLVPSIDRRSLSALTRLRKLELERRSIDLFRRTARFFSAEGEKGALSDDIIALMVLRHYGVPTRLLDWSRSPYVAAYFAVCDKDTENGEIWSFNEPAYERAGKEQWRRWPETTSDGNGEPDKFAAGLTAFTAEEPPDWFICAFYPVGFPRQIAQEGAYSMTARFNRDHADAIADLLVEPSQRHRYVIEAALKPALRRALLEDHRVWRGSLFPDSAGAAETAHEVFRAASPPNPPPAADS